MPANLVKVLAAEGKTEAFEIQAATLADTLAGGDVLGRGKTGSGKTLAFSIPMVARLAQAKADGEIRRAPGAPTGLVLAPTRELATQIAATLSPLAQTSNLVVTTVFGGVKQGRQVEAFRRGVDIVVACPGRLEDLMSQGIVRLDKVRVTVLDEADHMADLGFLPGVTRIMKATPADGQRLLFSATLDNGVDVLARKFLHSPTLHSVDEASSPVPAMTHHVFEVAPYRKNDLVAELASGRGRRILFTRTKHQARKWAKKLTSDGIPAVDLHGNLSQPQRDRNLSAFADGSVRVLVATDVAARGVHVDGIELVVHVDPPAEHKAYLHRSGRTARAGSSGDVVTVCLPEQRRDVAQLLRKAKITVRPQQADARSEAVDELVGERAPRVKPQPVQQSGTGSQNKGTSRPGQSSRRGGTGGQRGGAQRGGAQRGGAQQSSTRRGGSSRGAEGGTRGESRRGTGHTGESRGGSTRGAGARGGNTRTGSSRGGASRTGRGVASRNG